MLDMLDTSTDLEFDKRSIAGLSSGAALLVSDEASASVENCGTTGKICLFILSGLMCLNTK